jgi:protein involved in polysaccharide export with SLBB domain
MNTQSFTRLKLLPIILLLMMAPACHSHPDSTTPAAPPVVESPGPGQYLVTGGVPSPGPRPLHEGETVSTALAQSWPVPPGKPMTLVLIRRAPEGKTRQLIELDAAGKLMDEKQDYTLRDGDELFFPTNTATMPALPGAQ